MNTRSVTPPPVIDDKSRIWQQKADKYDSTIQNYANRIQINKSSIDFWNIPSPLREDLGQELCHRGVLITSPESVNLSAEQLQIKELQDQISSKNTELNTANEQISKYQTELESLKEEMAQAEAARREAEEALLRQLDEKIEEIRNMPINTTVVKARIEPFQPRPRSSRLNPKTENK